MFQKQENFHLALVTGATSGLGRQLCLLLAAKGIPLIIHGRDQEKLHTLMQELENKVPVKTVLADLKCSEQQDRLVATIKMEAPDLVINNAGFGLYGNALEFSTDEQLAILQVDGAALLKLSLEAARAMQQANKKGVIMNISSAAAFPVSPSFAVYSAVKAFVNQFSESFDREMRPLGIAVLVACPGVIETNFRQSAGGKRLSKAQGEIAISALEAAKEIYQQIIKRQSVRIFSFPYRVMVFFVRYLLPKALVAYMVSKRIYQLKA